MHMLQKKYKTAYVGSVLEWWYHYGTGNDVFKESKATSVVGKFRRK